MRMTFTLIVVLFKEIFFTKAHISSFQTETTFLEEDIQFSSVSLTTFSGTHSYQGAFCQAHQRRNISSVEPYSSASEF